MITKGIIVKIEGPYSYKVRIPLFDKIEGAATATQNKDLASALVCCSPGSKIYYSLGDVVFVSFEESKTTKPIILGQLYREDLTNIESLTVVDSAILNATLEARLPENTSIGSVSAEALQNVLDARNNLQKLIDLLDEKLSVLSNLPRQEGLYVLNVTKSDENVFSYTWSELEDIND